MGDCESSEEHDQTTGALGAATEASRRDPPEQRTEAPDAEEGPGGGGAAERLRGGRDPDLGRAEHHAGAEFDQRQHRIAGERSEPPRARWALGPAASSRDAARVANTSVEASISRPAERAPRPSTTPPQSERERRTEHERDLERGRFEREQCGEPRRFGDDRRQQCAHARPSGGVAIPAAAASATSAAGGVPVGNTPVITSASAVSVAPASNTLV